MQYDVIVVGAGHAGCEAAAAAAQMGARTLLITMNMQTIAQMSCNPAMGGVAKGQIVREIDALGGWSGIITDRTMIQFRMLNRSKGPAMWSPRAQSDRLRFAEEWRYVLEGILNLDFRQETVASLMVQGRQVQGVRTHLGNEFRAKAVILTNGTFLNGLIHVGDKRMSGGRSGEKAATGITEQLAELGFETGRMKTGTPPRIDGRTIDYSKLEVQPGDENPARFSYLDTPPLTDQMPCHIGYTNQRVHDILQDGLVHSPLYNGVIKGTGPRYCPSIEDKIVRFADKTQHQLFVEPEGRRTVEVYLNGFSSSLPEFVQQKALEHIPGFENARMFRPGYAIEYDYFPPHQLRPSLETQLVDGLFFAGQINGTTGYEEAGAQGIMAGINAVQKIRDQEPLVLRRDQAYIGVLIDDLIHKSTTEPYRMFTSRAEFRILLRQDNADLRLTALGHRLGLASDERLERVQAKEAAVAFLQKRFAEVSISPDAINGYLEGKGESPLSQKTKALQLVLRPNLSLTEVAAFHPELQAELARYTPDQLEQAEIHMKYEGYIKKEAEWAEKLQRLDELFLPTNLNYDSIPSLSNEAKDKLARIRPSSLGAASRISGVRPSDITVLMVYLGR